MGFRHRAHPAVSSPGQVVFSHGGYQPMRPIMNDRSDLRGCMQGVWGISWTCPEHSPAPPLFQTTNTLPNTPGIRPVVQDQISLGKTTSGCQREDAPHRATEEEYCKAKGDWVIPLQPVPPQALKWPSVPHQALAAVLQPSQPRWHTPEGLLTSAAASLPQPKGAERGGGALQRITICPSKC